MQRSKVPYIFLALSAALAVSALILLITKKNPLIPTPPPAPVLTPEKVPEKIHNIDQTIPEDNTSQLPEALQLSPTSADPARLVNSIAAALEKGDFTTAMRLLGESADPATAERLKELAARRPIVARPNGIREVGELDGGQRTRWLIEVGDEQIQLELKRVGTTWQVDRVIMPKHQAAATTPDALSVADAFLQSVIRQNFEASRRLVDPKTVSYAKIAGLCILFEEGHYILRPKSPLRMAFERGDTTGYLVSIDSIDGSPGAQFALNLRKTDTHNWIIVEINLDSLLAEFARKFADGDVYYTPLVKNPSGGDTLALYFDFDADQLDSRTTRQLEIVSMILRADTEKKIHIGGHTDALGTEDYNLSLSGRRANVVQKFLISAGVDPQQIVMKALGASQPLRPNTNAQGQDNPDGRRVNRRAEIYLDF